ncbi:hypothetical protein MARA_02460 (plasmid) [Mycolicibacterium arabiense]|uniref:Uncharacterized protein n=1 Tax=Mycolicibacterium arabiense TaxID=1286181 RepID=A0A7I7RRY8_9MYCO|nr:hypothetical protein MARA_02460 [Mycolicibacterium arabiense]
MLGEGADVLIVDHGGAQGDRRFALIDESNGHVASAKQARLWRTLLQCQAFVNASGVHIRFPGGRVTATDDEDIDELLSSFVGRPVHLMDKRPPGATLERADPEQVLERGLDAEVDAPLLELAQATPGTSFTDFAPLHAITTATLCAIGVEAERYRPNLVIETPLDHPPTQRTTGPEALSRLVGRVCAFSVRLRGASSRPWSTASCRERPTHCAHQRCTIAYRLLISACSPARGHTSTSSPKVRCTSATAS